MQLAITQNKHFVNVSLKMLNRHGVIAGASGGGKTITVKYIIEQLSLQGVPCFFGDIKGDVSGFLSPGNASKGFIKRCKKLGVDIPEFQSFPVNLYDVFKQHGQGITTSINSFGSELLANCLELNSTQTGVLNVVFSVSEDEGLPLFTLNDLRQALIYCYENNHEIGLNYGSVSKASIGAIQRSLLLLEKQGGNDFFNQILFDYKDLLEINNNGHGVISLLDCRELVKKPKLYASFLIWLLSTIYDNMPEQGDLDKPLFCMFFDEAHLIFDGASKNLVKKIEQIARLIRSKGIGVYFCSQSPSDIPDTILAQCGLRVQHTLRGYTPKALRQVKAAALSMRKNPNIDSLETIQILSVGEALISVLDDTGTPTPVEKAYILPPASKMGVAEAKDYNIALAIAQEKNKIYEQIQDNSVALKQQNNGISASWDYRYFVKLGLNVIGKGIKTSLKLFIYVIIAGLMVNYMPFLLLALPALLFRRGR